MKRDYKSERLYKSKIDKYGCNMKIIKYNKAIDIIVEFQDKYKAKVHTSYSCFEKNGVKNPNYRLGETSVNFQGYEMKIINYNNCDDIIVEFNDILKTKMNTQYASFIEGDIKNLYHPNVYNIGFLGVGKHVAFEHGINTKKYDTWNNMLSRCYSPKIHQKYPTYKQATLCHEWHNFQTFGDWYDDNYYEIENESMELDKDILFKGNKLYSINTCIFVTSNINTLFTKRDSERGEFPIGVHYRKDNGKYRASCSDQLINRGDRCTVDLGQFDTFECAFNSYKKYKEQHIKDVAEHYRGDIPVKLYNAMYRYEVEITD